MNPYMRDPRAESAEVDTLEAERAARRGETERARELYARAAEGFAAVAVEVPATHPHTRADLAAAALAAFGHAGEAERAAAFEARVRELDAGPLDVPVPSGPQPDFHGELWREGERLEYAGRIAAHECDLDRAVGFYRQAARIAETFAASCEGRPGDCTIAATAAVWRWAHARDFAVAVALIDRYHAAPEHLSDWGRHHLAGLRSRFARAALDRPVRGAERAYVVRSARKPESWTVRARYVGGFWTTDASLASDQRHPDSETAVRAHCRPWEPVQVVPVDGPPVPPLTRPEMHALTGDVMTYAQAREIATAILDPDCDDGALVEEHALNVIACLVEEFDRRAGVVAVHVESLRHYGVPPELHDTWSALATLADTRPVTAPHEEV